VNQSVAEQNQAAASLLSNNLPRLLREFSRDFERRIRQGLSARGHEHIRTAHNVVFANLGAGAVRVTELARRAQVTQQAMGKMLKELERMGYISRRTDNGDKRAKEIRLTARGLDLISQSIEVINEVCAHYASKAGAETLNSLEQQLRDVVGHLELDYLPPAWTEQPLTPTDTSKKP